MKLIQHLLNPDHYPHSVQQMELIETHISWVILTGEYVYKLKKPVNFGFLDFSTLQKRQHYCREELRLNKRLAPQIYLNTVSITGSVDAPCIDGPGPVLDYAVKMRQFRQQDQFDRLLDEGKLRIEDMLELARIMARFHQSVETAPADSAFGAPDRVLAPVEENFTQIGERLQKESERVVLDDIIQWSRSEFDRLRECFAARKLRGFIRECHGDMHLRNIAKYQDSIIVFDCIEFNDNLRWIDVISEVAFIEMDLYDRGRRDLANVLLNAYLQHTGDYAALALLRFYLVYRAMVRAKVDCLRAQQEEPGSEDAARTLKEYAHYLLLAREFTRPEKPFLLITCGLSGCGKTYASDRLMEFLPFVRLRSDVERKRLHGLHPEDTSESKVDSGIYTAQASQQTYFRLQELARDILSAQWSVLVDAAFLRQEQREPFRALAAELRIPFLILHFSAPRATLIERISQRLQKHRDASEADLHVLEHQLILEQPPASGELDFTLQIDSSGDIDYPALAARIQERLKKAGRF